MTSDGYKIVLTADRTLMSEYRGGLFFGFSACVPTGLIPDRLYFSLINPSVEVNEDGSVKCAPCGIRKIEAALLDYGFDRDDVVVAHPEYLAKLVGPKTRVVGVSETDPLGIGPATSSFTQLLGEEAYMAIKFKELLRHPAIRRFKPKIVVGGPGAWQLEDEEVRRELGIDCVVVGEGEKTAGPIFEKAVNGEELPEVVHGKVVPGWEIPIMRGPTICGVIEIARGCGRGCKFCVPTLQRYRCLPIEHILKEVGVNLRAGKQPLLHAEDVLRYKAKGVEVNKEAVVSLFRTVCDYPGVESASISHFALSSVAAAPDVVEEISNILCLKEHKAWLGGQTGIETGSPRLMGMHMAGKCRPFKPEDWPDIVVEAFDILSRNNWIPATTLILGLPGETDRDLDLTIDLVERLRSFKSLIVPLFMVSMGALRGKAESFTVEDMTLKHSELYIKCWEHDLFWVPSLLDEYCRISISNRVARRSLEIVFSYALKQLRGIIRMCRDEYGYDLTALIRDVKRGRTKAASLRSRLTHQLLKLV
jgi:radical SAM superfamily enzyme YgiQ (UPF0313 family)